jgi:hypothetical protein
MDPVGPLTGELPRVSLDDTGGPPRPHRFRPLRLSLKLVAFLVIVNYIVLPLLPDFTKAIDELRSVNPALLAVGLFLQLAALYCYSLLTKAALGAAGHTISRWRLFRIQMSTKSLSNIVPGGSAAGPALGYRLMTLSGVEGPSAGFALATAGLGSAVVLNLLLWVGLIVSIPIRGVNKGYGLAAVAGIIVMLIAAVLVLGLMDGQGRAERALRWIAGKLHLNEDRAGAAVRQVAGRLEDLARDPQLLVRVGGWATANWLLDAASLWVFLRAFGVSLDPDALIIAFAVVNVMQVIPIMPGGLGIVEAAYAIQLAAFGVPKIPATLAVASYRIGQYWLPTVFGGVLYASLRVGPFSIERRDKLVRMRELAAETDTNRESALDFAARFGRRRGVLSETATGDPVTEDPMDHSSLTGSPVVNSPVEGDGDDDR